MNSIYLIYEMGTALERHASDEFKAWKLKYKTKSSGIMYKAIMNGKCRDDESLSKSMGFDNPSSTYRAYKTELKKDLESLFLYVKVKTTKGKQKYEHVKIIFNKEFAIWQNMYLCGANNAYVEKGEALFVEAKKYNFTMDTKNILTKLIGLRAITHNKEKYEKYNKEKELLEKELDLIGLGMKYLSKLQNLYANTKASKVYLFKEIEKDYLHFLSEADGVSSPSVDTYRFLLKIYLYSVNNSHQIVFETAKGAKEHFEQYEIVYVDAVKSFNYYLIEGYAKQGNYEMMKHCAEENLNLVEDASAAWFKSTELYTFSSLHLGYHDATAEMWYNTTQHEMYGSITPISRDVFRFIEAHLHLLKEVGIFVPKTAALKDAFSKPFRFNRFVNDLEISSSDKQGLTIVQILLEVAFLLVRKQSDDLMERIDAVDKFFQRHTELEGHERILAFFRLIKLGLKYHWKKAEIMPETLPHYEVLANTEVSFSNQRFDMEFIPYRSFFETLIEKIPQKKL